MTDKPIIVDNIDVSKCEFLIITNDKHLCRCIKSDLFGGIEFVENAKNGNCENNPNCYFKLLQQEKQNSQESRDTSIKENTHLVIKRKLINERLCKKDRELFYALLDIITKENYNEYIICNKDEPYADKVLQTILQGEAEKEDANKIQNKVNK